MEAILEALGHHKQLATEQICKYICPQHSGEAVEQMLVELEKEGLVARSLLLDQSTNDFSEIKSLLAETRPPEMPDQLAMVFWNLTRAGRARVNPPIWSLEHQQTWRNLEVQLNQEVGKAGANIILMEELCPEMDLEGDEYLVRLYAGTFSISTNGRKSRSKTKASLSKYLTGLIILVPEWVDPEMWWYRDIPRVDSGMCQKTLPVLVVATSSKQSLEHKEILEDRKQQFSVTVLEDAGGFIPTWLKENGVPEPP